MKRTGLLQLMAPWIISIGMWASEAPATILPVELPDLPISVDLQDFDLRGLEALFVKDLALPFRITGIDFSQQPPISLHLERMKFRQVVRYISLLGNLDYSIGADGTVTLHAERPVLGNRLTDVPQDALVPASPMALDLECHDATPSDFALAYGRAMGLPSPLRLAAQGPPGERVSLVVHDAAWSGHLQDDLPEVFFHTDCYAAAAAGALHVFPQQAGLRSVITIDVVDRPIDELCAAASSLAGISIRPYLHMINGAPLRMPLLSIHAGEGIEVSHLLDDLAAVYLIWSMAGDGQIVVYPRQSLEDKAPGALKNRRSVTIPTMLADRIVSVDYHALPLSIVALDFRDRLHIPMQLRDVDGRRLITLRLDRRSLSEVLLALRWICGWTEVAIAATSSGIVAVTGKADVQGQVPIPVPPQQGDENF